MELRDLLDLLKANPIIAVWLVLMVLGGLGRMVGGDRGKARRTAAAPDPTREKPTPNELEERIRRNFEEMLRRRGQPTSEAAQPAAPPPPAPHAPRPPPVSEPTRARPAMAEPTRARPAMAEPTRARPATAEPTRVARVRREPLRGDAPVRVRSIAHTIRTRVTAAPNLPATPRPHHAPATSVTRRARPAELGPLNRRQLRRAVILREVLDPPLGLREE